MVNILVCNQKGGVGKSLIADELAFSFERSGISMSFLDLDAQGGTIHQTSQRDDAEVSIIDTPGALQQELKDWIAAADIIVIPTRTTSRDIEPLLRMQKAVEAAGKSDRTLYVLNGWNRWRASGDFLEWFRSVSRRAVVHVLPQSEQFVHSGAAGVSVVGYARKGPAVRATLNLCNAVRGMVGFEPEDITI